MTDDISAWQQPDWVEWTRLMLETFARLLGQELLPRKGAPADSDALFHADFVAVAHGTQDDPLLNYGNQTALSLWQMSLEQLIGTPSRQTAEPVHREERARLLQRTQQDGYIDDYSGIRISSTGRRFRIHRAVVWNVFDDDQVRVGQAATFSEWEFLEDSPQSADNK